MKVKPPKEDPAAVAARAREQARADSAYIANAQDIVDDETRSRQRRLGSRRASIGASMGRTGGGGVTPGVGGFTPIGGGMSIGGGFSASPFGNGGDRTGRTGTISR